MPHDETYAETLTHLDDGVRYDIRCPDGVTRVLWGYTLRGRPAACIEGWTGDAWIFRDKNDHLRVTWE